jgi:hypothetical protein
MRLQVRARALLLASVLAASPLGCGSEEAGAPMSFVGESASREVAADEGAELSVGAVKLKVPSGALEQDEKLEIAVQTKQGKPHEEKIALDVYDFGPDGLTFKQPVEIEFDLKQVKLAQGEQADVVTLDEQTKTWRKLPDPERKNGKIKVKTTHFSLYTVLVSRADSDGEQCTRDFTACGGELAGSWRFASACLSAPAEALGVETLEDPRFATCSDVALPFIASAIEGTARFGTDGSFSIDRTVTLTPRLAVSLSCLEDAGQEASQAGCAEVQGAFVDESCVLAAGEPASRVESLLGSYDTYSWILTLIDEPEVDVQSVEYCVEGDRLTLRIETPATESVELYEALRE